MIGKQLEEKKLIHLDLRPENFFIFENGGIKLSNIGHITKVIDHRLLMKPYDEKISLI